MIHTNKWTNKIAVVTCSLHNFEYKEDQGTNNVKMDLEEIGYVY